MPKTRFEHIDPILNVSDLEASVGYYVNTLGFEKADWVAGHFTCVMRDACTIYLCEGCQGNPGTWVWTGVENVDTLYEEYKSTEARVRDEPANYPWAWEMRIEDLDGNVIRFGSDPKKDVPFKDTAIS
jgi:predicted lactoylglutathione lyase